MRMLELWVNMQLRLTNSQRYLANAKLGTNHSTNPTNPTTKCRCEFVNLNCIHVYTELCSLNLIYHADH